METWAQAMIKELDASRMTNGHIGLVRRYLRGEHDIPYMPEDATGEFKMLAEQAVTNLLPLISGGFANRLRVDGYRSGRSADNVEGWEFWQVQKLDSRQTIPMRGAIEYGTAYVVLEGDRVRTPAARKTWAWYEDDEAEFPLAGIIETGVRIAEDGAVLTRYEFWHEGTVTPYERTSGRTLGIADDPGKLRDGRDIQVGALAKVGPARRHGRGGVPWVRFRDRMDDEAVGVIRPLIRIQNRINASVFYLLMALHYASFRQRWGTGLSIPRDRNEFLDDGVTPNPNFGKPIEPFKAAVNRLWVSESSDTKFGDFQQTDTSGHLAAIESAMKDLITAGSASPLLKVGDLANVGVDAIDVLNDTMHKQVEALQESFAGSWEALFALRGIGDPSAAVRWRDVGPKSFTQVIDGLTKLHSIGAPAEGLFELVPDITDQMLERWIKLAERPTDTDNLADAIRRQGAPAAGEAVPAAE